MCISRQVEEDLADTPATLQQGTDAMSASGTAGRGTAALGSAQHQQPPALALLAPAASLPSRPGRAAVVSRWGAGGCTSLPREGPPWGPSAVTHPTRQQQRCRQPCQARAPTFTPLPPLAPAKGSLSLLCQKGSVFPFSKLLFIHLAKP